MVFGLHLTGIFRLAPLMRERRVHLNDKPAGYLGTLGVGMAFGAGWTPCIGPILGAILTYGFSQDTMWAGVGLLSVYSLGLAVPFLIAGWSIEYFFEAFSKLKHHFRKLEVASGMILVGVGMLLVTNQLTRLNSQFSFMNDWISAAEKALQ